MLIVSLSVSFWYIRFVVFENVNSHVPDHLVVMLVQLSVVSKPGVADGSRITWKQSVECSECIFVQRIFVDV